MIENITSDNRHKLVNPSPASKYVGAISQLAPTVEHKNVSWCQEGHPAAKKSTPKLTMSVDLTYERANIAFGKEAQ